jgi:hypothetical protein
MKSAANMLLMFDDEFRKANMDLSKTFDPLFAKKAGETIE